jgi:hypothetical protein
MIPGWALLGAFSRLDDGTAVWFGAIVGGLIGVFGLMFGGNRHWHVWD